MTDKLEIFYNDLTEAGQKKINDFDDTVPKAILESEEPMFSARKKPDSIAMGDSLHKMAEEIMGRLKAKGDKTEVPPSMLKEALERMEAGEDVAGIILDKISGEYKMLTKSEAMMAAKSLDCEEIDMLDTGCNCPSCQAKRAGNNAPEHGKWS